MYLNLIVPACVSASHVAFSSIRTEVQYPMLGHVAGLAATLALRDGRPVQSVDTRLLQRHLRDAGQVLGL
ncbi:FAD-dependent oxidoreductase [Micromonospora sp. NPDC047812]|uniref:FAD-dependent oxidoreductase n=1 Tax=Micromonospora sp. NPDC047812 TaxID=3155742 RepID=UPI0034530277